MGRLIITIHNPKKQKVVADALLSVKGEVTLVRATGSPRRTADGKIMRRLTAKEKKDVAELRKRLKEVNG